jgi:hypothetical protein
VADSGDGFDGITQDEGYPQITPITQIQQWFRRANGPLELHCTLISLQCVEPLYCATGAAAQRPGDEARRSTERELALNSKETLSPSCASLHLGGFAAAGRPSTGATMNPENSRNPRNPRMAFVLALLTRAVNVFP